MITRVLTTHDSLEKAIKLAIKEQRFELSESLEQIVARYRFAYDKRMIYIQTSKLYKVRFNVVEDLVKEFGISIKQAYLDYANASKFLDNAPSLLKKEVAFDLQIEQLDEDMMMARDKEDLKSLAALHKIKADLLKSYPSHNVVDWATMEFPEVRPVFDPKLIKSRVIETPEEIEQLSLKLKEKYSQKTSQFLNSIAIDVEAKEDK